MSLYAAESQDLIPTQEHGAEAPPWWPWVWALLVCGFLGASSVVSLWQDRRFVAYKGVSVAETFPLKDLPARLGVWEAQDGSTQTLDPLIARIAGSSDSLVRRYVDRETGVVLDVLVLYGRAEQVSAHTAEVCYPAVGYEKLEDPVDVPVRYGPSDDAKFRSLLYAKQGSSADRYEVYYAFRQGGAVVAEG